MAVNYAALYAQQAQQIYEVMHGLNSDFNASLTEESIVYSSMTGFYIANYALLATLMAAALLIIRSF